MRSQRIVTCRLLFFYYNTWVENRVRLWLVFVLNSFWGCLTFFRRCRCDKNQNETKEFKSFLWLFMSSFSIDALMTFVPFLKSAGTQVVLCHLVAVDHMKSSFAVSDRLSLAAVVVAMLDARGRTSTVVSAAALWVDQECGGRLRDHLARIAPATSFQL